MLYLCCFVCLFKSNRCNRFQIKYFICQRNRRSLTTCRSFSFLTHVCVVNMIWLKLLRTQTNFRVHESRLLCHGNKKGQKPILHVMLSENVSSPRNAGHFQPVIWRDEVSEHDTCLAVRRDCPLTTVSIVLHSNSILSPVSLRSRPGTVQIHHMH